MMISITFLFYSSALFAFFKNKGNLLSSLLVLESLLLIVFLMLLSGVEGSLFWFVTFLYVVVCEGAFGSSVLVQLVRGVGGGGFYYYNMF